MCQGIYPSVVREAIWYVWDTLMLDRKQANEQKLNSSIQAGLESLLLQHVPVVMNLCFGPLNLWHFSGMLMGPVHPRLVQCCTTVNALKLNLYDGWSLTDSWLVGLSSDLTTMNSRCGAVQATALGCIQKADLTGFCMCERFNSCTRRLKRSSFFLQ